MAKLTAQINRHDKTARFFGPGTFSAKEQIKELGPARWLKDEKVWEVREFTLTTDELRERLPGVTIQGEDLSGKTDDLFFPTPENSAVEPKTEVDTTPEAVKPGVPEGVSVSRLIADVRAALRRTFSETVLIHGGLSHVKHAQPGRVYMDLSDADRPNETVRCVIWQDSEKLCEKLQDAGFKLEADLQVMFKATVDLNPRNAQISLTVTGIVVEYTIAKLSAEREITNERLKKEGLFAKNKDLKLSFLPRRLGVLTSAGGTVINDFRASLDISKFGFELFWLPVSVQGAEAKKQLLDGILALSKRPDLDAVLVFRGGGSPAELAVFNDYEISRAICLCPFPVLSAIGHETDQSSVQDVSFRAFGVPKDIGRFFCDIVLDYRQRLSQTLSISASLLQARISQLEQTLELLSSSLTQGVGQVFSARAEFLRQLLQSLPLLSGSQLKSQTERLSALCQPLGAMAGNVSRHQRTMLSAILSRIDSGGVALANRTQERLRISGDIAKAGAWLLERSDESLQALEQRIKDIDPKVQLKRGFSLVRRAGGEVVTSGADLKTSEMIDIEFHDQSRNAKVQ